MNLDHLKQRLRKTHVEFRAGPHTYHLEGRELASVGSVVGRFEPEFDLEYWAGVKARERGVTALEIMEEWSAKAQQACDKGHKIHEHIQAMLTGPGATCDQPEVAARLVSCWNACEGMHDPEVCISGLRSRSDSVPAMCAEVESLRARNRELTAACETAISAILTLEELEEIEHGLFPETLYTLRAAIAQAKEAR